eukprot:406971_1
MSQWICSVCEYHQKNCSSSSKRFNCKKCYIFNRIKSTSCSLCTAVDTANRNIHATTPVPRDKIQSQTNISSGSKNIRNASKEQKHSKKEKKHSNHHHSSRKLSKHSECVFPFKSLASINGRYVIKSKLTSGSFSIIHTGIDIKDNNRPVIIKLEPINPTHHPQLEREYKIYQELHNKHKSNSQKSDLIRIPKIYYFGKVEGHPFNALIMDMLGPSLEKLFNLCNRKFSLKTVLMIADQMLSRLEFIHDNGYLHRDLKPDNFLMGMYN